MTAITDVFWIAAEERANPYWNLGQPWGQRHRIRAQTEIEEARSLSVKPPGFDIWPETVAESKVISLPQNADEDLMTAALQAGALACAGDRDDPQAYSCDLVGSAEAGLGSLRSSTAFSKFLQGFAMHREFSTTAIYADSHLRESPYCGRVEIFTTRKVDVHLCSEHPKIRRFTQPAHTVNT